MPYLLGFAGLGAFWLVLLVSTGKHPWSLVMGEDGRPSTSKFQMLVWTAAVVFGYLAIYQLRVGQGHPEGLPEIPQNLLLAMGISVATTISAKAIAVNSSNRQAQAAAPGPPVAGVAAVISPDPGAGGQDAGAVVVAAAVVGPAPAAPDAVQVAAAEAVAALDDLSGIFQDAGGAPDLGKVQVVLWTLIAVGVFLSGIYVSIEWPASCVAGGKCNVVVPDIGKTLMILMGLGHGAYIGNKIAQG